MQLWNQKDLKKYKLKNKKKSKNVKEKYKAKK